MMEKGKCGCTYPGKKREEIVLLVVDDISRVPLVSLLGVSQPDSAGPGLPSTAASQPLTAPVGKINPQDEGYVFIVSRPHPIIKTIPTSKSHPHHQYCLHHQGHAHMCPCKRFTSMPNLHHQGHTHSITATPTSVHSPHNAFL